MSTLALQTDDHRAELEDRLAKEGRRGVLVALPFVLPTMFLLERILGPDLPRHVQAAFALQLLFLVSRVGFVGFISKKLPIARFRTQLLETASALSLSVGMAVILITAGELTEAQILQLALVVTAVSSLALQGMASRLLTYLAYVSVQFGALLWIVCRAQSAASLSRLPLMIGIFVAALSAIAVRANRALRMRILLSIQLREAGWRDALTGLRNRKFASVFAEECTSRLLSSRPGEDGTAMPRLAFLLIDIDHFKKVNDVHGHAAGDDVLVAFGLRARGVLRRDDVIARWGGEEFLVIMQVSDGDAAIAAAERLRRAIAAEPIQLSAQKTLQVTCSIGASILSVDVRGTESPNWQHVVERADQSLYRAKSKGRNRTICDWQDDALVATHAA